VGLKTDQVIKISKQRSNANSTNDEEKVTYNAMCSSAMSHCRDSSEGMKCQNQKIEDMTTV